MAQKRRSKPRPTAPRRPAGLGSDGGLAREGVADRFREGFVAAE